MRNYVAALNFLAISVICLFLVSCSQKDQPDEETMIKNKETYRDKIEMAKDKIDKLVSDLQSESDTASESGKKSINRQIDRLKERRGDLNARLDELGKTTKEKWNGYKEDVDKLLSDLDEDFRDVTRQVRDEGK